MLSACVLFASKGVKELAKLTALFDLKDRITNKLKKIERAFDRLERITETNIDALDRLDATRAAPTLTVTDKLTDVLERIERKLDDIDSTRATATVDVEDKASAKFEKIESMKDSLETPAMITVGAATAGIGGSIMAGQSAAEQDAKVSAVTGMTLTDTKSLIDAIYYEQQIGATRADVAESTKNLTQQTNLMGKELEKAIATSNKFAQLADKDIPEVDRAIASTVNNLKESPQQIGDAFAYIYKHAGDQYDDLLDTFNEYSSTFKDLGINSSQIASAFVAGTAGGARNFDELADAMREFNIRRNEMTDDQVKAMTMVLGSQKEVEKMYKGMADGTVSGGEALMQIANGLSKIENKAQRHFIATTLIGTKYEDLKQPILDMADALDKPVQTAGELNRQYEQMKANDPFTDAKNTAKTFQQQLSETGKSIMTGLNPAIQKFNAYLASPQGQQQLAKVGQTLVNIAVAVGGALLTGIEWMIDNWDWFKYVLGTVVAMFGTLWGVVKIGRPLFQGITATLEFFTAEGMLGTRVVGWLGKAFTGIGGALSKFGGFIMTIGRSVGGFLTTAFTRLLPWISRFGVWILRGISIGLRFIPVIGWIVTAVMAAIWVWQNWDKIKEWFGIAMDWVSAKIDQGIAWLADLGNKILESIGVWDAWEGIKTTFGAVMDWINNEIAWISGVIDRFMGKVSEIKQAASDIASGNFSIGLPQWAGGNGMIQLPSHAKGISGIPYDGYVASLHKKETVLPAEEADALRTIAARGDGGNGGGGKKVIIQKLIEKLEVHNEADEDRLIAKLKRMLEEELLTEGDGVYVG